MTQSDSVPRLSTPDAMILLREQSLGAIRAKDVPRKVYESGRAGGDHARMRTDPDDAERDTGIYGCACWWLRGPVGGQAA